MALERLEAREAPATGFLLSAVFGAVAGVAADVLVTAVNADGSTDTAYSGTVHFQSSDTRAALPADTRLTNGVATLPVTFLTAGTQTLVASDTADSTITGSFTSSSPGGTGFSQPPSVSGGLIASSWLDPNGSDADMYAYDNFSLSSNQSITQINWRGGYLYGAPYGRAQDFSITIFDSILGGSQPLVTNPQLPEIYLAQYHVGGNASETYVGTVSGTAMYDYSFSLPTAFQATGGHTYWVRIEASQVGYPDWGVAVGTGGNNQHFQFSTGSAHFSYGGGDEAFTIVAQPSPGVNVSPAATSQFVVNSLVSPVTAGAVSDYAVTAQDAYGNLTPGYTGTVHFTSTDPLAVLPADYFFSSTDQGRQTFTATLKTAGDQSLSASDLSNASITAGQAVATVNPAAAAGLTFAGFPASTTAGVAQPFTVRVVDQFGNVASDYTGTIHFGSSDPLASLPTDYKFTATDKGVHPFSATLKTTGTQTLTAADSLNPALAGSVFTAGSNATFDFDTGTPVLHPSMGIPLDQTVSGISAHFSSPNAWLAGGFSVQSHSTTFYNLSQFSGNYLYPNSVYNPTLDITFSRPLSSITFTYATADFGQNETPTTVQVTAYQDAAIVGSASSHGTFSMGDTMPQGTLTFNGAGQTFNHVFIQIPWAPLAASDMLVDNIAVTAPNVTGVVVNPVSKVAVPSLAVNHQALIYDGAAHGATATAMGTDGATPVAGSFSFTYNGSATAPTLAGTYSVLATFTSNDPSYSDATATGSLTINPAAPTVKLSGGPFTYNGAPHGFTALVVGVNGVIPVNGNLTVTYNGSSVVPTAAGIYTVAVKFQSTDPNYGNVTSSRSFTIKPAASHVAVMGGSFFYDGKAHAAGGTAVGVDGSTPVAGKFTLTYNGSAVAPTAAGTYIVAASFKSFDANYADAAAGGILTIQATRPVFSSLSSPLIVAGTTATNLFGHIAAGSVLPAGGIVAITLNGVTRNARVDASGNFAATFSTASLRAGRYGVVYAFTGDGTSFLAAPLGLGTLTVVTDAPQILVQPQSQTVFVGSRVSFTAAASGIPLPSVQWQVSSNGGQTWKNLRGATRTTLSLIAHCNQNGCLYRAVFTNPAGKAATPAVKLTLLRRHR